MRTFSKGGVVGVIRRDEPVGDAALGESAQV